MPDCSRHLAESLRSGRFQYRTILVPQPAVASGFSFTIDSLGYFQPLSVRAVFAADATVSSRVARLEYQDGDGIDFVRFPSPVAVVAGQVATWNWIENYGVLDSVALFAHAAPLSDWLLLPGWRVALNIASIQAGDQVSAVRIFGRDWVTLTDAQTAVAERMEDL